MTYLELKKYLSSELAKIDYCDSDREGLEIIEYVSGIEIKEIIFRYNESVTNEVVNKAKDVLKKRKNRLPLAYITGKAVFFGYEFKVSKDVLIPRSDTEFLCECTLNIIKDGDSVADICTGTGCIGITLCKQKNIYADLFDISKKALEIAKDNVNNHGLNNRIKLYNRDVFSDDFFVGCEEYNLIISNPPYIQTSVIESLQEEVKNEPRIALDGGEDGLDFYRRIIDLSINMVKSGGHILFEIGYDEGEKLRELCESKNLKCEIKKDYSKNDRVCIISL